MTKPRETIAQKLFNAVAHAGLALAITPFGFAVGRIENVVVSGTLERVLAHFDLDEYADGEIAAAFRQPKRQSTKCSTKCARCRKKIAPSGKGRPARYCSASCRSMASRERKLIAAAQHIANMSRLVPLSLLKRDMSRACMVASVNEETRKILIDEGVIPPPSPPKPKPLKLRVIDGAKK